MNRTPISAVKHGDTIKRGSTFRTVATIEPLLSTTGRVMAYRVEYRDVRPGETLAPTAHVWSYPA